MSILDSELSVAEITQATVLGFIERYRKAYESGDTSYFSFFTPDASFFTLSSPTRIDSREEFKRSFAAFSGVTRRSQVMAPEIRIMSDSVLVTCHDRITVNDVTTNVRETFVLVLRGDGLKIAHLHCSPLPLPAVPATAVRDFEEISILEERVATAASQVGTPK